MQERLLASITARETLYLRDSEGRAPVVLEDVQADLALAVDVAVVDASLEGHLIIQMVSIFTRL